MLCTFINIVWNRISHTECVEKSLRKIPALIANGLWTLTFHNTYRDQALFWLNCFSELDSFFPINNNKARLSAALAARRKNTIIKKQSRHQNRERKKKNIDGRSRWLSCNTLRRIPLRLHAIRLAKFIFNQLDGDCWLKSAFSPINYKFPLIIFVISGYFCLCHTTV